MSPLVSLPSPFILQSFHSPLQIPPSAQKQTPSPCLLSLQNWPSYTSLPTHLQTPCPCLCPDSKSPSYSSPFSDLSFPLPSLTSSFQQPSQTSPFLYQYTPQYRLWFLNSPLNISPLNRMSSPLSSQPFFQIPLKTVPQLQKYWPWPYLMPLEKSPIYLSLLRYYNSPRPCGRSLAIYPLQTLPSEHTILPLPNLELSLNQPTQISPLILFLQNPFPCFWPRCQSPQKYSSGELSTPEPFFRSQCQFPEQYASPLLQMQVPGPSFSFLLSMPSQISPVLNMQIPWPWKQSCFHWPKQMSPLGQVQMP